MTANPDPCFPCVNDSDLETIKMKIHLSQSPMSSSFRYVQLNANEIQIPYDKHHKVSSSVKSHQNTHNSVKYEVIIMKMPNNPGKYKVFNSGHTCDNC